MTDIIATQRWDIIALFLTGVVLAIVVLILFRKYVAPWLGAKREQIIQQIGAEEYEALTTQIKTFMAMAEQQIGAGNGKAKSELVIQWIKQLFPGVREDYVQALIDGFMKVLAKDGIVHMTQK